MGESRPGWLPDGVDASSSEDGVWVVRVPSGVRELSFGRVPDGARVTVVTVATGELLIDAEATGKTTYELQTRRRVTLGHGIRRVLIARADRLTRLVLRHSSIALRLEPGYYEIDNADGCEARFHVETIASDRDQVYRITGTAWLLNVTGPGSFRFPGDLVVRDLNIDGDCTVDGELQVNTLRVSRTLECHGLIADAVEAETVEVDGDIRMRDELRADSIGVRGRLTGRGEGRPKIRAARELHAQEIAGVSIVGGSALTLTADACGGELAIEAEHVDLRSLAGSGTITASTIRVEETVVGEGGPLVLSARERIHVGDGAADVSLLCDENGEGVHIGEPFTLTRPLLDADTVEISRVEQGPSGATGTVERCTLVASAVRVGGPVSSSLVKVSGRAEFLGDVDCTDQDAIGDLLTYATGELGQGSATAPVEAGELLIAGELRLAADQQVGATSLVSVSRCSGGRVRLLADDGLFVAEELHATQVTAGRVGVAGVAETGEVQLGADGVFHQRLGRLTWSLNKRDAVCRLGEGVDTLTVDEHGYDPVLECLTDLDIGNFELIGGLTLKGDRRRRSRVRFADTLTLHGDSHLRLDKQSLHTERLAVNGHAGLALHGARLEVGALDAVAGATLTIEGPGAAIFKGASRWDPVQPLVRLRGNVYLSLDNELRRLECPVLAPHPTLALGPDGAIEQLAGGFILDFLAGRVDGRPKPGARRHPPAPVVTGLSESQGRDNTARFTDGQLLGVDITGLHHTELELLAKLHVLDPDQHSLRRYAATRVDADQVHRRAQKLKFLADTVSTKAISGATRSAANWASARAHHATIDPRTHPIEAIARGLHRLVGYGQRPLPAFLTYLAWLVLLTAGLFVFDGDPSCANAAPDPTGQPPKFSPGPYNVGDQFLRALLAPAALLRLDSGGATSYAPIGCHSGWHVLALAVTAPILIYLGIALKNYLRSPSDQGG